MTMNMVRVRAVQGRLVSDLDALDAGLRRFVGQAFDKESKTWKPTGLGVFIDAGRPEYKRAIKAGDLVIEQL